MAQIGVEGCLLVWASQCLAFIRYRIWLASIPTQTAKSIPQLNTIYRTNIHHENLTGDHIRYNRAARTKDPAHFSSLLTHFQPAVAWIGLLGCLSIVLLFSSANMWNGTITVEKVAAAYVEVSRLPPPPRLHNAKSS